MKEINFENLDLSTTCMSDLAVFFEQSGLENLGREVKFVQRKSELTSWMFLRLNTCFIEASKETSLNDLVGDLSANFGVEMRKKSLDGCFNAFSVQLMKRCFEKVLEKILASNIVPTKASCVFDKIILRDATSFQLPAHMSSVYLGNAG